MTKRSLALIIVTIVLLPGIGLAEVQEASSKFMESAKNLSHGNIFKKAEGNPKGESTRQSISYTDSSIGASIITVNPEVATPIEMSSSDMNRIQCPTDIKDVVFSKEKGVTVKIIGKNAFLKFLIMKRGEREVYSSTPTEIFLACDESIYNIIAIPKRIPSQTIRLNAGIQKIKKNASLYAGMPFEKKVVGIIKSIYTDEIPDSFTMEKSERRVDIFRDLDLMLHRIITVDGEGLIVKEYRGILKGQSEKGSIDISEKDFLRSEITTKPMSIMVDRLKLKKGDTAKILIVEGAGLRISGEDK